MDSKNLTPDQIANGRAFTQAIRDGDADAVRRAHAAFPQIMDVKSALGPWMYFAARRSTVEVVFALHDLGADPNLTGTGGADGSNALGAAASAGSLEKVQAIHRLGGAFQTDRSTTNTLLSAVNGGCSEVVDYLLSAGFDATLDYQIAKGVRYDVVCFALESGARQIASQIALHVAAGDTGLAQAHLDDAWDRVQRANPNANPANVPPPPILDVPV